MQSTCCWYGCPEESSRHVTMHVIARDFHLTVCWFYTCLLAEEVEHCTWLSTVYCASIPISTASQSLSRDFLEPVGSLKDTSTSKRIQIEQVCTLVAASPSRCSKLKQPKWPRSSPGLTRYLESTPLKLSNSANVILISILSAFSVKKFLVYIKLPLHIQG